MTTISLAIEGVTDTFRLTPMQRDWLLQSFPQLDRDYRRGRAMGHGGMIVIDPQIVEAAVRKFGL